MSFKKASSFKLFISQTAKEEPVVSSLEYDQVYINIPDKKVWAVGLNTSTRKLEAKSIVDPAVQPGLSLTDESTGLSFRIIVRDGSLCFDKELTATGFSGVKDQDWEQIYSS